MKEVYLVTIDSEKARAIIDRATVRANCLLR